MRRVFIIHGWAASPSENWFPWLKRTLESMGYEVQVPVMPSSEEPRIDAWVSTIANLVGKADEDTYFIGHSMGCAAIVRYLQTLPDKISIGGAVFVAGFFFPLTPPGGSWNDKPGAKTNEHWATTPIDFNKVKTHLKRSIAIFSDNDPWVPLQNKDIFSTELGSDVVIEHNAGHLNDKAGFRELPAALDAIINISQ